MTTTIRRNSKRIKNLADNAISVTCYSLDNGFRGTDVPPERFARLLATFAGRGTSYYLNHRGLVTARIHSNLWYEINDGQ